MALNPIKTSAGTGYCDCICGCYNLVSLRDDETGRSYCPACAEKHLPLNAGLGLPQPSPSKSDAAPALPRDASSSMPSAADPPGRLR